MLVQLLTHLTYVAIFGLLVAGGLGIPVPEEMVQLTSGYLAHQGLLSFLPALVVTWLGLVVGDFLLFRLGRRHGPALLSSRRLARLLTPARRAFIERHFARHAVLTIMAARHASGFRLPVFALAGASGVPSRTFLLADGASALVSVPLVMGLGWLFAGHVEELKKDVHEIELLVAGLAALSFAAWVVIARWRKRRNGRRADTGSRDAPDRP
ncbi:MAG TPA: DedA family protein [Anaeromyxobacteraceae bacterium]